MDWQTRGSSCPDFGFSRSVDRVALKYHCQKDCVLSKPPTSHALRVSRDVLSWTPIGILCDVFVRDIVLKSYCVFIVCLFPSVRVRCDQALGEFRRIFKSACKGGYTLVTLPRIVTPYRDSVDETRDRVTYQKLYIFFWVIPRRLNFICRRFGTLFHLHRQVGVKWQESFYTYLSMKMEQTECSETSAYKIQTPGITQKKTYDVQNTVKVWNQE